MANITITKSLFRIKQLLKRVRFTYSYEYRKEESFIKILADDVGDYKILQPDNEFNFSDYSRAIVNMINGSRQKFSVGIYSEWGTGKTTLMRLVEKDLKPIVFDFGTKDYSNINNFLCKHFTKFDVNWIKDKEWKLDEDNNFMKIINEVPVDNMHRMARTNHSCSISITLDKKLKSYSRSRHCTCL